jgi:hypothetical protein
MLTVGADDVAADITGRHDRHGTGGRYSCRYGYGARRSFGTSVPAGPARFHEIKYGGYREHKHVDQ